MLFAGHVTPFEPMPILESPQPPLPACEVWFVEEPGEEIGRIEPFLEQAHKRTNSLFDVGAQVSRGHGQRS